MKDFIKSSYFKTFLILLVNFILIEISFRAISGLTFKSFSILRILIQIIIISTVFSYLLNFLNNIFRRIASLILILLFGIYAVAQLGFHEFLGVYMSFQTSSQLGAVTDYISDFIKSFKWFYFIPLITFVISLVYFIFFDKKLNFDKLKIKKASIISLVILVISSLLFYGTIVSKKMQNKYQTVSNKNLFLTASNPSVTIDQYGTIGFCFLDIKAIIIPVTIKEEYEVKQSVKRSINENSRIIDDTPWKSIIDTETNNDYKYLNNYFISREIPDKNDYTGMFDNKNVIVIMMESANDILLNDKYYPNFAKLLSEGWYFENNYSPRNSCATMNNEFSGMTSLYSIYNTCTASKYKHNTYFESIFGLFNDKGYVTFSAHDYTQAYYPRKTIHLNMGSGEYYGVEKLNIKYSREYRNWADDDDFMAAMLKVIDKKVGKKEHFMTWLTTVSGHQPYNYDSNQGNRYYNMTKNTRYPSDVRRYMSKLKILDNGLGVLLDGLEKRGILDDTVIVLYGDHYPYGISKSHLNKALDYNTKSDYNAERVPLVIYNSKVDSKVFSQYTSYINILPTIANLFNLNYDPRLYLGEDLLSKDYNSITVFADGSWKNEKAFYNASKNKIKYYSSDEYTEEEIQKINFDIQEKINISNKAIKSNYFSYLGNKLTSEKEEIAELRKTYCLYVDKEMYDEVEEDNVESTTTKVVKKTKKNNRKK